MSIEKQTEPKKKRVPRKALPSPDESASLNSPAPRKESGPLKSIPLTGRQERFVGEYLVDLNGAQAAVRAGYGTKCAKNVAYKLLQKPQVAAAIRAAQSRRAEKSERTALDVLRDIQEVAREAKAAGDLRTALKGLELEGKHLGLFFERLQVAGRVIHDHQVSPDVEAFLARLAGEGGKA